MTCLRFPKDTINNDGNRDIDFDTLPSLETTSIGSIDHINNLDADNNIPSYTNFQYYT
jgi:hypothetical protein